MPDEIYEEASDRELDRLARGGAENPNNAECTAMREDIISQVHRCTDRDVLADVLRVFEDSYNVELKERKYARVTKAVERLATSLTIPAPAGGNADFERRGVIQEKGRWEMGKSKEPKPAQKHAPGKVPAHYVKPRPDPPKKVGTMEVGETKHIASTDFGVDADGEAWINPDALVFDEISRHCPVSVERVKDGYAVGLMWAYEKCQQTWDNTSDRACFTKKGWLAVNKVV